MPGTTPIYGFPYPEPSDLVANYPALGQQLAEDVENTFANVGKILQITRNSNATNFTTTSTTFVDMSGMDVTITPKKSSSVIYLIVTSAVGVTRVSAGAARAQAQITDSSNTPISGAQDHTYGVADALNANFSLVMIAAITAVNTAARTYKVRHKAQTGCSSLFLNANSTAQIIAMEYDTT
jgi:hypothetical protein